MKVVTEGTSRIVFVFEDFVVKLPWLNIVRAIKSLFNDTKSGVLNNKIKSKVKYPTLIAWLIIPIHVLCSNLREYAFYKKYKHEKVLMPTKAFLFGNIIIQPRGAVLSKRMERWKKFYRKIKETGVVDKDLENPRNFSIFMGKIVMHDYGNYETQHFLVNQGFQLLSQ